MGLVSKQVDQHNALLPWWNAHKEQRMRKKSLKERPLSPDQHKTPFLGMLDKKK